MVTGVTEQVPRYTISHIDDGIQKRLHLTVSLPGLTSAKDFEVRIESDKFILQAEGRYNLTLPLHPPVEETAEVLQFVKRKALLKAELKVLSASDQSASAVSPSSSSASPSFAYQSNQADESRGCHNGTNAPDPDSDDESIPDLSNESDSSPTFSLPRAFAGHAKGAASSASGQSTSTSHAQTHGQPYHHSPESESDMSDMSPHVRRWSIDTGAAPDAGGSAHAAMHGNLPYGVSPAAQASHVDAESSSADSPDEAEDSSLQHPYNTLQQPQTKQSLETAAAYFKQGFELLYTHDWQQAANLLFEAQLLEGTTCSLLPIGIGSLPAGLAADVRCNVGAILLEKIEDRMQRNGSGAAKTVKAAWEQAHAVLLLQAIGHPAAVKYGLTDPAAASTVGPQSSRQEQRTPQAGPSRPSNSSWAQAAAAHSTGRQRSSAAWPTSPISSRADQEPSGSETSEQEQEEQQHQFLQQLHGQRAPTPASHGPAEQAEAKRQANKEAALTWLDKAKAAAANKDWTAAVQKAQRGLSLDPDADWVREANSLVQSWQAAQQKEAGGGGPADKQSGSGKPHAQAKKGKQQKQSKKQAKKQKRQAQQQQQQQAKQQEEDQLRQQQQQQQQQEQSSSSKQHDRPKAADNKKPFGGGASGSAAHGHHSYTYGPQGQQTESAEPQMNSPSVATFEWLSAVLSLVKLAAGCVGRGCRLLSRWVLRSAVYAAALLLLCVLMVPQITVGLLYLTGRRDWCCQLAAARKAGKVWAKLVYFVFSPLLALMAVCALFCLVGRGSFASYAAMTASWVAWPLVQAWRQLKSATSWLHPSKAFIHVILLLARMFTKPSWVRYLSSGLLLWWSMNGGWTAVVTTLLASIISFFFCVETLGTPVACKLSHAALTNTYLTGYFYRAVMMVLIWGCWIFWQALWREFQRPDQSNAQANPQPKPASDAPRPAQGGLPRTGSTDAKTEVRRILSAKTHYAVLEVDHDVDADTVKRAKKMKSLLVHPDKAGDLTGAGDAFGKVIDAAEVLCDPNKKRQYDAEQAASAYQPSQPAAPQRRQEKDDPNVFWQLCSLCEQLHRAVRTDMAQQGARWCKECKSYHTVQKGEGWVTKRGLWSFIGHGEYVVYACLWPDGQIYDVTEQSICQGMLDTAVFRQLGPDCHQVWLHFSNPEAANRRQRYQPPNESAGRKKSKKAPRRRR